MSASLAYADTNPHRLSFILTASQSQLPSEITEKLHVLSQTGNQIIGEISLNPAEFNHLLSLHDMTLEPNFTRKEAKASEQDNSYKH